MKKMLMVALIMAIVTKVSAQEAPNAGDNQRISVYLHPITLIAGLAAEELPFLLYITGEVPLNGSNSLIINPSLWAGDVGGISYSRLGSGIGIRFFPSGEAKGFYLQAMGSANHLSIEEIDILGAKVKVSGFMADILGYIGYSAKYAGVSVFIDFGIGRSHYSIDVNNAELARNGLTLDVNLGIGIPF